MSGPISRNNDDDHDNDLVWWGAPADAARLVVVVLHGRDQTPDFLADHVIGPLGLSDVAWVAPRAPQRSWYPQSFLVARQDNEPRLSASLATIDRVIAGVIERGVPSSSVVVLGFSQGACLGAEFVWQTPRALGALVAFTGGLIGPPGTPWAQVPDERHSLRGLPVLLATSARDPFVPLWRVMETASTLTAHGAAVQLLQRDTDEHAIDREHLAVARELLLSLAQRRAA